MHRLDSTAEGSLHRGILGDNVRDAQGNPGCCNWAAGVQRQYASLSMAFPYSDYSGGWPCSQRPWPYFS